MDLVELEPVDQMEPEELEPVDQMEPEELEPVDQMEPEELVELVLTYILYYNFIFC
jgi:hypothetical protein